MTYFGKAHGEMEMSYKFRLSIAAVANDPVEMCIMDLKHALHPNQCLIPFSHKTFEVPSSMSF